MQNEKKREITFDAQLKKRSEYSCFDKGCPKKRKSVRDNAER